MDNETERKMALFVAFVVNCQWSIINYHDVRCVATHA